MTPRMHRTLAVLLAAGALASTHSPAPRLPVSEFPDACDIFPPLTPLQETAAALAARYGENIELSIQQELVGVSVRSLPEDFEERLNGLSIGRNLVWFKNDDGSYGICTEEWYKRNCFCRRPVMKIFRPNIARAQDLADAIRPLLTPGHGSISVSPRNDKVIVSDEPEVIREIERLMPALDQRWPNG